MNDLTKLIIGIALVIPVFYLPKVVIPLIIVAAVYSYYTRDKTKANIDSTNIYSYKTEPWKL